jgi:hypothetical protein
MHHLKEPRPIELGYRPKPLDCLHWRLDCFSSFLSRTGDLQVGRHASVRAEEHQIQRSSRRTGKPDWRGAHAPTVAPRRQPEGGDKAVEELAVANGAEHEHRRRAGASTRADRGEGGRRGGRGRGTVLAPEGAEEGWPAGNSLGSVAWRSSAKIRHAGRPCSSPPPSTKKVESWSQRSSSSFAVFKAA